jgi:GT2 family glycosyltransferase
MTPSISVIIPAYQNTLEVLRCLNSLQTFASKTLPIEFIVSDDHSADPMAQYIGGCMAKVITRHENGGFAANANTGAQFAQGDILFVCNQDVAAVGQDADGLPLSQDWDIHLVNAFENAEVGIVGAKLLFPDGRVQNAGGFLDGRCQPFHRGLGYSNHRYAEVNTPEFVSWTTGAALAVRRDLFNQLGGFDTLYGRGYFEDVDMCMRAHEAGFKVWYEPRCVFIHTVGTSGGSSMFGKNAAIFRERWVDSKRIVKDTEMIKERFW